MFRLYIFITITIVLLLLLYLYYYINISMMSCMTAYCSTHLSVKLGDGAWAIAGFRTQLLGGHHRHSLPLLVDRKNTWQLQCIMNEQFSYDYMSYYTDIHWKCLHSTSWGGYQTTHWYLIMISYITLISIGDTSLHYILGRPPDYSLELNYARTHVHCIIHSQIIPLIPPVYVINIINF